MPTPSPANLIGLDYRQPPAWRMHKPIVDMHTHVYNVPTTPLMFEAADLYGIGPIVSMSPLADLDALQQRYGDRLRFIAIPNWKALSDKDSFREQWIADLRAFRERGAAWCKFWMAPRLRREYGLTLDHPWMRPVVNAALELGFDFMVHVGDPTRWFARDDKYADASVYGTKPQQYEQLDWFCEYVGERTVIGAHMGGTVEDPPFLRNLLDRHPHYLIDTSATKWIVREVAARPDAVRSLVCDYPDRVLFGSDLVVKAEYDTFDHYASRYWCQRTMWERDYRGPSPIEDPDAGEQPQLAGLNLPDDVLEKVYGQNARRVGLVT